MAVLIPCHRARRGDGSAGGYAWAVDRWTRLDRFLVLGSEGGTFMLDVVGFDVSAPRMISDFAR